MLYRLHSSIRMWNGSLGANLIHKTKHIFLVCLFLLHFSSVCHSIGRCMAFAMCESLAIVYTQSMLKRQAKVIRNVNECANGSVWLHKIHRSIWYDKEKSSPIVSTEKKETKNRKKRNRRNINENEAIGCCCALHFAWVRVCATQNMTTPKFEASLCNSFQIYRKRLGKRMEVNWK